MLPSVNKFDESRPKGSLMDGGKGLGLKPGARAPTEFTLFCEEDTGMRKLSLNFSNFKETSLHLLLLHPRGGQVSQGLWAYLQRQVAWQRKDEIS